jgi:2-amino-4-hydroxy-6-hydroxymethyldihydropteridine diphosphokinase
MNTAYIGLGSNLRSPERQILAAFDRIAAAPRIELLARSSLYRSAPVGYAAQPDFVNAVAALRTTLSAHELLDTLLEIERRHGRVRELPNGPRTLDLDVLIYGDMMLTSDRLALPHPRAHERAFVLLPLVEIAPHCVIPGRGRAADWLPRVAGQQVMRIAEEVTLRMAYGTLVGMA